MICPLVSFRSVVALHLVFQGFIAVCESIIRASWLPRAATLTLASPQRPPVKAWWNSSSFRPIGSNRGVYIASTTSLTLLSPSLSIPLHFKSLSKTFKPALTSVSGSAGGRVNLAKVQNPTVSPVDVTLCQNPLVALVGSVGAIEA